MLKKGNIFSASAEFFFLLIACCDETWYDNVLLRMAIQDKGFKQTADFMHKE